MQPNAHKRAIYRTDAESRKWPCTPKFKAAFMALVLDKQIKDTRAFLEAGVWVNNYLKQFYRSSTAQDAFIKPGKGENNMVIGTTPEIRKQNNEAWQEALRQQEQKVAIEVGNKIELVMEFMRATNPLKYTLNDLFENVILCLKKDGQFSPQKERLARQMIYGEKSNESH